MKVKGRDKGGMKMYKYEVGQVIERFKGRQEGVLFDMADDGATLVILFNKPTQQEIQEIKQGKLQFGMFVKEGIIFILSKFGSMSWMDAPYHVALSKNLTALQDIDEGKGYGCHIVLADTATGEIKAMRLVGLSTQYSKKLKANIESQKEQNFNELDYARKLNKIFNTYSTKEMVNYSEVSCRIKSEG